MMRRSRILSLFFVSLVWLFVCAAAYAHDDSWTRDIVGWDQVVLGHDDADPFKGWATLTVTNTILEQWGDFHFQINDFMNYNVTFPTDATMLMLDDMGQPYQGYSYAHNGAQMLDFVFDGNPVLPGETVTFKVYTDNTANQHAWFGLCVWPTPVPEPATVALLGLGAIAVLRRRR